MKVLYISYDSVNNPIFSSQVKPIIEFLGKKHQVYLVTFEKKKNKHHLIKNIKKHITLKFQNKLYEKIFSMFSHSLNLLKICKKNKVNLIINRSYYPQFLSYILMFFFNVKIIFDTRGLWLDEKKDFKKINYFFYFLIKRFEKKIYKISDKIIMLSEKSKKYITCKYNLKKKDVISTTTFVDLNRFKFQKKNKSKQIRFVYTGSVLNSYNFKFLIKFFTKLNDLTPNWNLSIYNNNKNEIQFLKNELKQIKFNKKIKLDNYDFSKNFTKIYKNIDIGIYFINNYFSKIASCPTKLGEILSTGTPVITNPNIGDINKIVQTNKCGLLLTQEEIHNMSLKKIFNLKKNFYKQNAVSTAKKLFNPKIEIKKYEKLINDINF